MLSAKLFAGLATAAFGIAMLNRFFALPRVNLLLDLGRVALPPYFWLFFVALVCTALAMMYVSVALIAHRPTNKSLGLVSFLLVAISFASWMTGGTFLARYSASTVELVIFNVAAVIFFVGLLLSAVNLVLASIRSYRLSS